MMSVLSCLRSSLQVQRWTLKIPNRGFFKPRIEFLRGIRTQRSGDRKRINFFPQESIETPREGHMVSGLFKSIIFALGFSACTFVGAVICEHENTKKSNSLPFDEWVSKNWNQVSGWKHKEGDLRKAMNKWWNSLSPECQAFWQIFALNLVVFACWYHPAMKNTMFRYFCSTPAARAVCWPMVFSTFSHAAPLHLGINMFALHSFSIGISHSMGKEQFWGLYLVGGVASSLTSHLLKVSQAIMSPSLGASGAILAVIGYFCMRNPDSRLQIVFIPDFSFSASSAIKTIVCFDLVGIIFKWKLFDHAAHLGGALFGMAYASFLQSHTWNNRRYIAKHWENLRTRLKGD